MNRIGTSIYTVACILLTITIAAGALAGDCTCPDGSTAGCFGIGTTVLDGAGIPIGGAPQAPGTPLDIVAIGWIPPCDPILRCAPIEGGQVAILRPDGALALIAGPAPEVCPGVSTTLGTSAYVVDPADVNPQLGVAVAVVSWGSTAITPGAPGPTPGDGAGTAGIGIHVEGAAAATCPGDLDGSGVVDVSDLVTLIEHWGSLDPRLDAHALQHNHPSQGILDVEDLLVVMAAWGECHAEASAGQSCETGISVYDGSVPAVVVQVGDVLAVNALSFGCAGGTLVLLDPDGAVALGPVIVPGGYVQLPASRYTVPPQAAGTTLSWTLLSDGASAAVYQVTVSIQSAPPSATWYLLQPPGLLSGRTIGGSEG